MIQLILVPILSVVANVAAANVTATERGARVSARVLAICEDRTEGMSTRAARLTEMGEGVVPALLDVLSGDAENEELLLMALARLGPAATTSAVRQRLENGAPSESWRIAALCVIGEVGDASELLLAFDLCSPTPSTRPSLSTAATSSDSADTATIACSSPALDDALERTVRNVLVRHPEAASAVTRHALSCDGSTANRLVRALGQVPSTQTFQELTGILGRRPEIDTVVITEIGRLARSAPLVTDFAGRDRVRDYLHEQDGEHLRAAALAAGQLGDFGSCERLIRLLEHENEGIRGAARAGLGELTGLTFGEEAARWRQWLEEETLWFEGRGAEALLEIEISRTPATVHATLQELATRRYRRHELALVVVSLLDDGRPTLRSAACSTLRQLGSPAAIPRLVESLDDSEPDIATAAWTALVSITERELPRESEACREALSDLGLAQN